MAKEALFNIIIHRMDLDAVRVLDLFAGTGNISFEFLSRGAEYVMSVDVHPGCVGFIQAMHRELGVNNAKAVRSEASKFIRSCSEEFDIIFLDPPYAMVGIDDILRGIFDNGILSNGGLVILEHASNLHFGHVPEFSEARAYGQSAFSFFTWEGARDEV